MSRNILIMAGGTGGHIYPGLAVADALRAEGWNVTWLGAPGSMEAELVPKHGYPMAWVNFGGLRGKGLVRKLMLPFNLLRALAQSAAAIFRNRPDVVLGMGGYITFPGGLMASLLRCPLVIHEQNSVAGLSNKALAKLATRVLSGFPDVLSGAHWVGNPVRESIAALPDPAQRYTARSGKLNVLVVGGSLGAQAINECLPQALMLLTEEDRPDVLHQTGKRHFARVQAAYQQAGVSAEVRPFLDDMALFYAQADLMICRAGALTVAELAAAGVASVLVPFPFAVDDHQTGNAKFLADHGAAILLPQTELTPQKLADLFKEMTHERALAMAEAARKLAKPDSAQQVANICKELAA
ncbi:MAG: undecaprenyldiphospho-muramoylpentapeptide beta-N-acetylglucosaminyltransferase [Nitrosomonadales bacterium]|nr:undecaprenyldiphospho-muramoylpentapeptide beta-N-acetylglucosaminyltransferase [Nitrosomonadales bacterium]